MRIVLLGAPGAGKGTQARTLSERLGVPAVSTGNLLRVAIKNGTGAGQQAKMFMDAGQLVPDDIVVELLRGRLAETDCERGYILDGYPRSTAQARALEELGIGVDAAVEIYTPDEVVMSRMTGRRYCPECQATYHIVTIQPKVEGLCDKCGAVLTLRHDDEPETVRRRLEIYHRETEPVKAFYESRGKLKTVIDGTIAETAQKIAEVLGL